MAVLAPAPDPRRPVQAGVDRPPGVAGHRRARLSGGPGDVRPGAGVLVGQRRRRDHPGHRPHRRGLPGHRPVLSGAGAGDRHRRTRQARRAAEGLECVALVAGGAGGLGHHVGRRRGRAGVRALRRPRHRRRRHPPERLQPARAVAADRRSLSRLPVLRRDRRADRGGPCRFVPFRAHGRVPPGAADPAHRAVHERDVHGCAVHVGRRQAADLPDAGGRLPHLPPANGEGVVGLSRQGPAVLPPANPLGPQHLAQRPASPLVAMGLAPSLPGLLHAGQGGGQPLPPALGELHDPRPGEPAVGGGRHPGRLVVPQPLGKDAAPPGAPAAGPGPHARLHPGLDRDGGRQDVGIAHHPQAVVADPGRRRG